MPLAPHRTAGNHPYVVPKVRAPHTNPRGENVGTFDGKITQPLTKTDIKKASPEMQPAAAPRVYERTGSSIMQQEATMVDLSMNMNESKRPSTAELGSTPETEK